MRRLVLQRFPIYLEWIGERATDRCNDRAGMPAGPEIGAWCIKAV